MGSQDWPQRRRELRRWVSEVQWTERTEREDAEVMSRCFPLGHSVISTFKEAEGNRLFFFLSLSISAIYNHIFLISWLSLSLTNLFSCFIYFIYHIPLFSFHFIPSHIVHYCFFFYLLSVCFLVSLFFSFFHVILFRLMHLPIVMSELAVSLIHRYPSVKIKHLELKTREQTQKLVRVKGKGVSSSAWRDILLNFENGVRLDEF